MEMYGSPRSRNEPIKAYEYATLLANEPDASSPRKIIHHPDQVIPGIDSHKDAIILHSRIDGGSPDRIIAGKRESIFASQGRNLLEGSNTHLKKRN